ncbi:class II aldolase/adducin family protein [Thermomicrobium sp. CFH 73360]|uniref:class II aldolase/adducin family protein n=1 Tax=Thermomicrobium sp. CFH 73360 TaxID=2951987 RepID=UPI002077608C|nr:class II aldolase/adducin family protein [Thermomicrobium sp. CFH 73360]MCM8745884.1 class II aldolase/adducin family protein [Thermomicrobium sp. CFH 73360]
MTTEQRIFNQTEALAEALRILAEEPETGTFTIHGEPPSDQLRWFIDGLRRELERRGHEYHPKPIPDIRLVLSVFPHDRPVRYRRKAQATFVVGITEFPERPEDILTACYPYLLYALANLVLILIPGEQGPEAHFVTLERGHYGILYRPGEDDLFFATIYERLHPLAASRLVINNVFRTDLEPELWNGDEITQQISRAGKRLEAMNLLPAPFPVHELLSEEDLRHVKRLYGLGGLSYGNLSARKDRHRFWMSASGVNKAQLEVIGRDILMVSGFDPTIPAIILSVPPNVEPRRVSVDAIEHWMIYQQHPEIGAIVHVHAWMEGIRSTEINYPCGTLELALAVSNTLAQEPDPTRAVIGLKNHGVTITGRSMDEILERIEGKLIPQVPMS